MYTEQNRGFTVITNFGCDCHCKYCITKHHPILQNAVTDKNKIDWEYLEKCISESDAPTVNLSGVEIHFMIGRITLIFIIICMNWLLNTERN